MKQMIRNWLLAGLFVAGVGGSVLTTALPQVVAAVPADCNQRLLTFLAWYRGLQYDDNCDIKNPGSVPGGISTFIWTIVLNVIELLLQLVGYVAVGFIIVGGFKFFMSAGSSDGIAKARKTITNAVVGLIISIFSVAIVNAIVGAL